MVRKMYDSDRPSAIPTTVSMVAGYIDGSNPWTAADWARFPNAVKVRIARRASTNDGHVLDVETGIVWPPDKAVDWVLMRRKAGVEPTVYCNELYGWPQVKAAFNARGVRYPTFWVSRYNSTTFEGASIPSGAVARQYANPVKHGQGHWDESIVADYWPGVDEGLRKEKQNMSYSISVPPHLTDNADDYQEIVIPLPPQHGATGVNSVWVTISNSDDVLYLRVADWQCGSPDNHSASSLFDHNSEIDPLGTSGGQKAPSNAYSLVLDYRSAYGFAVVVEPVN